MTAARRTFTKSLVQSQIGKLYNHYFNFIITTIYIAHMQDGKINRQIESEAHKKVDLTNV